MAVTRPAASHAGEPDDGRAVEGTGADDRLSRLLAEAGMVPVPFPLLRLAGPPDLASFAREVAAFLDDAPRGAAEGPGGASPPRGLAAAPDRSRPPPRRWVVFTSRNALSPFLQALEAIGRAPEDLRATGARPVRVAAVGPSTARALARVGLSVDLVPDRFTAEDLLDALLRVEGGADDAPGRSPGRGPLEGAEFLFPRAERARDVVPRGLEERGAKVHAPVAYRTVADEASAERLVEAVFAGAVDVVTLTSSSAADILATALGPRRTAGEEAAGWPADVRIAVIGPVTAHTARARGLRVDVEPSEATLTGLVRAIAGAAA